MKSSKTLLAVVSGVILIAVVFGLFKSQIFNQNQEYIQLSAIVLIGLGLTVALMAILVIVYAVINVDDPKQALALPEGSVRALLAFSLVLIFVCLAAFLFSKVDTKDCQTCGKALTRVNDSQLADLKSNFTVAASQGTDKDGKPLYEQIPDPKDTTGRTLMDDVKHPLYDVTYYPKLNHDASDFAKQIFTTLATVFVSVVSFYFGSSVTASAVASGAKAAQGTDGDKKLANLQNALNDAMVDAHTAQVAVDQADAALKKAQEDLNAAPEDPIRQRAFAYATQHLADARKTQQDKQAALQAAQKALNDATGKRSDPAAPGTATT
jgi:phosphate/sulfate permease